MDKVLDASALINSNEVQLKDKAYTTPSVIKELKSRKSKSLAETTSIQEDLDVIRPKKHFLNKVKSKAKEVGSQNHLSDTDIDVIALALEKNCKISTDDYTIQNLAAHLNIPYEGVLRGEIKKKRIFK